MTKTPSTHFCFLLPSGREQVLPAHEAHSLFGVQGFLRADLLEHRRAAGLTRVQYFNLGPAAHQLGWTYGMTPVLRPGRRATASLPEMLPLLCGSSLARFKCSEVSWFSDFPTELEPQVLEESLLAEKSMAGLRDALMRRYAPADADNSKPSSLLGKGLTVTLLTCPA